MLLADIHGKQDKCCLTLYSILRHFDAFVRRLCHDLKIACGVKGYNIK